MAPRAMKKQLLRSLPLTVAIVMKFKRDVGNNNSFIKFISMV
jgi:hypothetical protein